MNILPLFLVLLLCLGVVSGSGSTVVMAKKHTSSIDKLIQIENTTLQLQQDNANRLAQLLTQLNAQENLNSKLLVNIMAYTHILELAQTKSINGTVLPIR